jgi:hypothetical protein
MLALLAAPSLSGLFLVSGWSKLADRRGFEVSVSSYGFGARLTLLAGIIVPTVELLLAISLGLALAPRAGAITASIVLTAFSALLVYMRLRGRSVSCGCLGAGEIAPVSATALARNGLFIAAALMLAIEPVAYPLIALLPVAVASALGNILVARWLDAAVRIRRYA